MDKDELFGQQFLDDVIAFIQLNFDPDEVFTERQLKSHICDRYEPDDIFSDLQMETWVRDNVSPYDLNEEELEEWAEAQGYVKGENAPHPPEASPVLIDFVI